MKQILVSAALGLEQVSGRAESGASVHLAIPGASNIDREIAVREVNDGFLYQLCALIDTAV